MKTYYSNVFPVIFPVIKGMAEIPDVFTFQDPIQPRICSKGKQQVGDSKYFLLNVCRGRLSLEFNRSYIEFIFLQVLNQTKFE